MPTRREADVPEPDTVDEVLALVEERPNDAELFQLLGRLYLRTFQFQAARDAYERSLALAPDDPWTHRNPSAF